MTPCVSTAMVMFSGLVWVGMLTAFGRSTFTVLLITGMVIRKMMSSTSITSTSGVVLMLAIDPPDSCPTLIAMTMAPCCAVRRAARPWHPPDGHHRPEPQGCRRVRRLPGRPAGRWRSSAAPPAAVCCGPAASCSHDCRHRYEQAERGHDERLADRAGHLVDARLPGDTYADQRVEDAPHRAEQPDEGRRRADGGEQSESLIQIAVDMIGGALQRHGDPLVEVDAIGQTTVVV